MSICSIHTYSSSDQSVVTVYPEDHYAVQHFRHESEFESVSKIATELRDAPGMLSFFSDGSVYRFHPHHFHSFPIEIRHRTHSIVWKQIHCLNQFPSEDFIPFLRTQWVKFFWDILRGIFGMFNLDMRHGDVSLDNIGIRDGKFVLYDYNLSRTPSDLERDLYSLIRSIRWRLTHPTLFEKSLFQLVKSVQRIEDYVEFIQEHFQFKNRFSTAKFLDALTIRKKTPNAEQQQADSHNQNDLLASHLTALQ